MSAKGIYRGMANKEAREFVKHLVADHDCTLEQRKGSTHLRLYADWINAPHFSLSLTGSGSQFVLMKQSLRRVGWVPCERCPR